MRNIAFHGDYPVNVGSEELQTPVDGRSCGLVPLVFLRSVFALFCVLIFISPGSRLERVLIYYLSARL